MTYREVLEWWKEYGLTPETKDRSDARALLNELYLFKMRDVNDEERWTMLMYAWGIKGIAE